ncbi:hypothetical protein Vretimale_19635 [Volvox reticuliferus]|uniref:Uncharacterized protein n=1 Tax=Volvox reticuliferus TaxID=1737510 RepID=A0A8J4GUW0_9CHLO|nr:hypothetical protein Vretifemale_16651 [Volvox reticuliferus]GIM14332.1 hypothetical protein Vretimale_17220 [Volvox reticuliferus]GIM17094.1 hypothetical protein Vretimale_19635 [Volvox reticuliferus]
MALLVGCTGGAATGHRRYGDRRRCSSSSTCCGREEVELPRGGGWDIGRGPGRGHARRAAPWRQFNSGGGSSGRRAAGLCGRLGISLNGRTQRSAYVDCYTRRHLHKSTASLGTTTAPAATHARVSAADRGAPRRWWLNRSYAFSPALER